MRLFLCLGLALFSIAPVGAFEIGKGINSISYSLPEPRLRSPITETVTLTGKTNLEFRWSMDYAVDVDSYDFRLYQGYQTTNANLIYKERLSSGSNYISIDAIKFADGQVYTWTLRQIALGGQKSDPSSSSFKVIKK